MLLLRIGIRLGLRMICELMENLFQDGSQRRKCWFDFRGKYEEVQANEQITYTADDGRKVKIIFTKMECKTRVVQLFEAETENQLNYKRRLAGNFK
jgi:hypothetical protein